MSKQKYFITITLSIIFIALVCGGAYIYFTRENTNSVEVYDVSSEPIFTEENFPKIDASTATQPLAMAFVKNFTGVDINKEKFNFTVTHSAYVKLINDEVDLILVTEPSEEELALAKEKGIELEVIPVVREGFVFFVNKQNSIISLTLEQIQKIYTGEITNWSQVGGENTAIIAYQRPVNSGSQTGMLSMVMKGIKMVEAPKERLAASMADIINLVSDYSNEKSAIGYSYYYYATTMYEGIDAEKANNIKMIGVNGVKPNNTTIKSGEYPLTTSYFIVINKADPEGSSSRKLAQAMLSERGQKAAEEAKYVPIK